MNIWVYLILIAALLFLAAIMLYARFATRSREKSLHHSPIELMFPSETISAARLADDTGRIDVSGGGKKTHPEIKVDRVAPRDGDEVGAKKRESEYFDELQEAAAGLAMLMRSSPVGRTEPVIFAPEEMETEESVAKVVVEETAPVAEIQGIAELSQPDVNSELSTLYGEGVTDVAEESVPEESIVVVDSVNEVSEAVEAVTMIEPEFGDIVVTETETEDVAVAEAETETEEVAVTEAETQTEVDEFEVSLPVEVRVLTMRDILGDQVSDRLDQIDEELDGLESLVRNIESSLLALDSADPVEGEEDTADTAVVFIPAAA